MRKEAKRWEKGSKTVKQSKKKHKGEKNEKEKQKNNLRDNSRMRLAKGFFLPLIDAEMLPKICRPASAGFRPGGRFLFIRQLSTHKSVQVKVKFHSASKFKVLSKDTFHPIVRSHLGHTKILRSTPFFFRSFVRGSFPLRVTV